MVNRILLRKMRRDLAARKGSLLSLVAIVAIGVGCYTSMASLWRDLNDARVSYYRDYRLFDFSVDLKRAPMWAVDEIRTLPNIQTVRGRIFYAATIDLPAVDEPISGTVVSMPATRSPVINDVLLTSGVWFSGENEREVILNESFAQAHHLAPGDRLNVTLLDKRHELLIVGTAMSPEFIYLLPAGGGLAPDPARFGVMYLTEAFAQQACGLDGAWNQIVGIAHDRSRAALDTTLHAITDKLDTYGVTFTTPIQEHAPVRFFDDEITGLKVSSRIMPSFFLTVAVLVLNVLMGRMVQQQRTEIGTLRALGYSRRDITRHYVSHAVTIGTFGGVTGLLVGYALQSVTIEMYRQLYDLPSIQAHSYLDIQVIGLVISIASATLGAIKGVRAAVRLEPADAMRPPQPERGGAIWLEKLAAWWNSLSFAWKMIFRTIFRNPFRSAVGVFSGAMATALIVSPLCTMDALNYLMAYEFERVSHQDLTLSLRDPQGWRAKQDIQRMPNVAMTEPQLSVVCDLTYGSYRKRIGITGIPKHAALYTPLDGAGRPITIQDAGLVLSDKLAEILHVAPGDTLQIRPTIGQRTEVSAVVIGTVETFFGLSAYADLDYLNRLLGERWSANSVLAKTERSDLPPAFFAAVKESPTLVGLGERTRSLSQLDESFGESMGVMMVIFIVFAGAIAFGSVLNSVLVSLSERQREVGTFRVLGYAPVQIAKIFWGESLIVNSLGIAVGLGLGIGLVYLTSMAYSTELYRFPVVIYTRRLVQSAALMLAFIILAQAVTYRWILKFPWLDVLKIKE